MNTLQLVLALQTYSAMGLPVPLAKVNAMASAMGPPKSPKWFVLACAIPQHGLPRLRLGPER